MSDVEIAKLKPWQVGLFFMAVFVLRWFPVVKTYGSWEDLRNAKDDADLHRQQLREQSYQIKRLRLALTRIADDKDHIEIDAPTAAKEARENPAEHARRALDFNNRASTGQANKYANDYAEKEFVRHDLADFRPSTRN